MQLIMSEHPIPHSNCVVCLKKIKDKFYLLVGNKKLHSGCIKCANCSMILSNETSCYEKNDEIYCKGCYFRYLASSWFKIWAICSFPFLFLFCLLVFFVCAENV